MKKLLTVSPELKRLAIISMVIHLLTAIFSTGFFHWDEHFQILEFLSYKLGHTTSADLPWEYEAGMRPWLQPAFLYFTSFLFPVLKYPFAFATLTRLFSGFIGFIAQLAFFNATVDRIPQKIQFKYFLLCQFLWFLPYLHIRFSSEGLAGSFYLMGMAILIQGLSPIFMAIFFALSFWLRFQMGFALLIPIAWWLWQTRRDIKNLALFTSSFVVVIGLNVLIDSWGYGKFTFAPWNYIHQNVVLGKTANFGINPWYDYLKWIVTRPIAPIGLFIFASIFLFIKSKPKDLITWSIIPFFLAHQLIGHKEFRFLFPLAGLLPLMIIFSWDKLRLNNKYLYSFLVFINLGMLTIATFKSSQPYIPFYQYVKTKDLHPDPLYFNSQDNPYRLAGIATTYYSLQNEKTQRIDSVDQLPIGHSSWFFTDRYEGYLAASQKSCSREYSSIPFVEMAYKLKLVKNKTRGLFLMRCP